jgi:fluoride ion exporter CrcB/FEX
VSPARQSWHGWARGSPPAAGSGSFLIGLLMTLLTERLQLHMNWYMFLVVGFLANR